MKIGVISDTHSRPIPAGILQAFSKVDLIIHAGDFCTKKDVDGLAKIKKLAGVHGNMDDDQVRKQFPDKEILVLEKIKVGIYHGIGSPESTLGSVERMFANDGVDVAIFGHTHQPLNKRIGQTLYFNPGSPNDDILAPYHSYGILEVHDNQIKGKIIKVK